MRAAEELQKLLAEEKRKRRPKLRLIKGGLVGAAIWAGVEWFRDYKRTAVALAATGITATGAVLVEQPPDTPGADPPSQSIAPATVEPTKRPSAKPVTPPRPPRTSPLRTTRPPMRIAPPAEAATPSRVAPTPRATKTPTLTAEASVIPPVALPPVTPIDDVSPTTPCIIDLLGVKLCPPRGRS